MCVLHSLSLSLEHEPGTTTTITTQKEFKETADVVLYPDSRGMFSLIPHFGYFHFFNAVNGMLNEIVEFRDVGNQQSLSADYPSRRRNITK